MLNELVFFNYETEFALFLAVLENSVLPMGCNSSYVTVNDVRTLNFISDVTSVTTKTPNYVWRKSFCDVKCEKMTYDNLKF